MCPFLEHTKNIIVLYKNIEKKQCIVARKNNINKDITMVIVEVFWIVASQDAKSLY